MLALVLCTVLPPVALALPLEQVADPRPASHVADPLHQLSDEERAAIDQEAARAPSDVLVVVVDNTDEVLPREYGTRLFNRWHVGDHGDGVILLAALRARRAEIVLGSDIDDAAHTAISDRIMADVLVPGFKAGTPGAALRAGAAAVVDEGLQRATPPSPSFPVPSLGLWSLVLVPAGGVVLLAVGLVGWMLVPSKCERCGARTVRRASPEVLRDSLTAEEAAEQDLGSVRYGAWVCACGHLQKIPRRTWSRYHTCRSCNRVGATTVRTVVIVPTVTSTGEACLRTTCAICHAWGEVAEVIPRRTSPSVVVGHTGGTTDWSSGSSGGSDSGGGGSSDGGGSSGSW